jgi:hypothetical protein
MGEARGDRIAGEEEEEEEGEGGTRKVAYRGVVVHHPTIISIVAHWAETVAALVDCAVQRASSGVVRYRSAVGVPSRLLAAESIICTPASQRCDLAIDICPPMLGFSILANEQSSRTRPRKRTTDVQRHHHRPEMTCRRHAILSTSGHRLVPTVACGGKAMGQ